MSFLFPASDIPGHMLAVALLLAAIAAGFAFRFVIPAWRQKHLLGQAIAVLEAMRDQGGIPDPERIAREAMAAPLLSHLWREYAQTLHPTRTADGATRWRATTLAETFLTEQALVDTPLRVEFYKHLPGILTGIGILGTFSGLIVGLTHFEVSASPDVVRGSLKELIQGVGHAFKISAIAIALAMVLTWIEKSLVVARHRQVERLNQLVDSRFDTGIGEEYLARLVGASEASVHQAGQLRQAMVGEMRQALTALLEQQQAASQRQLEAMGTSLAAALSQSLAAPMDRVAQALERLESRQGGSVAQGVSQAMGGLLDNFNGQIRDQLLRQSEAEAARQTRLLAALETTGQAFEASTRRLESLAGEAIASLSGQFSAAVDNLGTGQQSQQQRLTDQTDKLMGKVAGHLQGVTGELKSAALTLENCVSTFNRAGSEAMAQLASGSTAVRTACSDFAASGQEFGQSARLAADAGRSLHQAATALAQSTAGNEQLLVEQQRIGEMLRTLLQELQGTVALAQKEAALNVDVVSRLEAAAGALARAEGRADTYLQGVSEVLARAQTAFASNMEQALQTSNSRFHQELARAVDILKDAIEHLGDVLATDGR